MIDETSSHFEQEANNELRKKKLSDIAPITEFHITVGSKADLAELIEGPLLSACQNLYDKNIQTYMSSANQENISSGHAELSIIYDALSEKNKEVAQRLIQQKLASLLSANESTTEQRLQFEIPVNAETTWGDIEDKAENIANNFVKQRLMPKVYSPDYVMEYLAPAIDRDIPGGEVTPEYFEQHGYFYEPNAGVFFKSREDIKRSLEFQEGEDPNEAPKFLKVYDTYDGN